MSSYAIYRIYDTDEALLYIGFSGHLRQHCRKPWGDRIARVEYELCDGGMDALDRERALIAEHEPEFNVKGTRRDPRGKGIPRPGQWDNRQLLPPLVKAP